MDTARKEVIYSFILAIISIVFLLIVFEFGLRFFTPFPSNVEQATQHEKILGYVMKKNIAGIDQDGFRNKQVKTQVDVVTIGDSHTYGYNADADESWPSQLSGLLGTEVYNMGIGGYGLIQYRELFNRALEKKPKIIIVGLYIPNDIRDVCPVLANNKWWMAWAKDNHLDISSCDLDKLSPVAPHRTLAEKIKNKTAIGSFVSYCSKKIESHREIQTGLSKKGMIVSGFATPTLLSWKKINGLMKEMNSASPHNQLGLQVANMFFSEMSSLARKNHVTLKVLIIPSKQSVYYRAMIRHHMVLPKNIDVLARNEEVTTQAVKTILIKYGITHREIVDDLALAIVQSENIFPAEEDGHPLPEGYRIYAREALRLINEPAQ